MKENRDIAVSQALTDFTQRYISYWQQEARHFPVSADLYGISSPCVVKSVDNHVYWRPVPFLLTKKLEAVERAVDLIIDPTIQTFYTTQYAGDMFARFDDLSLTLLQVWSEDDFLRLQENLIGHLVTQRRLKRTPTLFIATTEDDMSLISVCNLSGAVILEQCADGQQTQLSHTLEHFLYGLQPQPVNKSPAIM